MTQMWVSGPLREIASVERRPCRVGNGTTAHLTLSCGHKRSQKGTDSVPKRGHCPDCAKLMRLAPFDEEAAKRLDTAMANIKAFAEAQ